MWYPCPSCKDGQVRTTEGPDSKRCDKCSRSEPAAKCIKCEAAACLDCLLKMVEQGHEDFTSGGRVVLDGGRLGTLCNPRGCFCGPKGEACWDIALDEGGGIQAHGGTFRLVDSHQNVIEIKD